MLKQSAVFTPFRYIYKLSLNNGCHISEFKFNPFSYIRT
jgi:hypothetical protein